MSRFLAKGNIKTEVDLFAVLIRAHIRLLRLYGAYIFDIKDCE